MNAISSPCLTCPESGTCPDSRTDCDGWLKWYLRKLARAVDRCGPWIEALCLYRTGKGDREIGEAIGRTTSAVCMWRKRNGLESMGTGGRKARRYVIYCAESGERLATGTAEECAPELGMNVDSFRSMASRAKTGRTTKYIISRGEGAEE